MAEIAAVGLMLAVPGVIDLIMRGAANIYDRIETFRDMDGTMARQVGSFACGFISIILIDRMIDLTNDLLP